MTSVTGSGSSVYLGVEHLINRSLPEKPWKYVIVGLAISQTVTLLGLIYLVVSN